MIRDVCRKAAASSDPVDEVASETKIEWTDVTWNPVAGCSMVSDGCTNCYAMRMAARLSAMGSPKYKGLTRKSGERNVWTGRINLDRKALEAPLRWRRPRRIFVNSMSDLFQDSITQALVERVWQIMSLTPQHTYQILTKRPKRMADILENQHRFPILSNVWLGTSVEDREVLHRLDDLRATPAAIRFVSFEPLLGSVGMPDLSAIDWAIVGGESGPRARDMNEAWVEEIENACSIHETAFFFKQWGGRNKKAAGRTYKERLWDDFPDARM